MGRQLLMVQSVTFAMKGKEILIRNGIFATVQRTPKLNKNESCGYSIAVVNNNKDKALKILAENGITVIGVREGRAL